MLKWLKKMFSSNSMCHQMLVDHYKMREFVRENSCNGYHQVSWMWDEKRNCDLYHCTKCSDWQTADEFVKRHPFN